MYLGLCSGLLCKQCEFIDCHPENCSENKWSCVRVVPTVTACAFFPAPSLPPRSRGLSPAVDSACHFTLDVLAWWLNPCVVTAKERSLVGSACAGAPSQQSAGTELGPYADDRLFISQGHCHSALGCTFWWKVKIVKEINEKFSA